MKRSMLKISTAFLIPLLFFGLNNQVSAQVLVQDSLALVALYDSTNGGTWTNNTYWLSDQVVGSWYGVTVSNNRVSQLRLDVNNLTGTIPPEMADLTGLTVLNLERNQISGSFPTEILQLTNLEELKLRNNNISGPIPDNIDTLANLETLHLFNNPLGGQLPPSMSNLSNLRFLRLNSTQLSGPIPVEFGNFSSLELLELGNNDLSDTIPASLGNLTHLTSLYLLGNQLSGEIPPQVGNLVNLDRLLLANNQLSGSIPPELGNLAVLENMQLQGNDLTGTIPAQIGNLSNLTILFLNHNQLTGPVPQEIVNLENLDRTQLNQNQLTSLPYLGALSALNELYIQDNKFTFKDIEKNVGIAATYTYAPQDSIGVAQDTTVDLGEDLMLLVSAGGANTVYQWIKDAADISGATDSTYTITSAQAGDAGIYLCRVTNTVASDLTLVSRPMTVTVVDPATIEEKDTHVPTIFALHQNYPNPFNPTTAIGYQLPISCTVEIGIYNTIGQRIAILVSEKQAAGYYEVQWDASGISSGVYYYRLTTSAGFVQTRKLVLLR